MKKKRSAWSLFLITTLVIFSTIGYGAGRGRVSGLITDSKTGDPLSGANVLILAKDAIVSGAATDLRGHYEIANISEGVYSLKVTYIGYGEETELITVSSGEKKIVNMSLSFKTIEGEEVIVTAQAKGQLSAINQQLTSNRIQNIVSSDKIQELPDANAAESIGRLPGVSLQRSSGEGNKVVLRGLSPKYNIITVEGVKIPSSDAEDRSVGLNMVSSEMLAGIEVSKSLTPDMDADVLGGTVNLKLKEAPETFHFNLRTNGGYNDLEKSFSNYNLSGTVSNRFFENKVGALLQLNTEKVQRPSEKFGGGYGDPVWFYEKDNTGAVVDSGLNVYTESAHLIDLLEQRQRNGGSLMLDFTSTKVKIRLFNFYSQMKSDRLERNNYFDFEDMNMPYELNIIDKVVTKDIRTHSLQNIFDILGTELNINVSCTFANSDAPGDVFELYDRESLESAPRSTLLYAKPKKIIELYKLQEVQDAYLSTMSKLNENVKDDNFISDIHWKVPFVLAGKISGYLKMGGKYHNKERKSDNQTVYAELLWEGGAIRRGNLVKMYPWIQSASDIGGGGMEIYGIPAINFLDNSFSYGNFLDGRYELGWCADTDVLKEINDDFYNQYKSTDYFLDGVESYEKDYSIKEELAAGYMMTEINFGDKLMILPGIRYEKMNTSYSAYHIKALVSAATLTGIQYAEEKTVKRENEKYFPMVNLRYKINDWSQIRGAYYKSTSRPSFNQLSPLVIYRDGSNYMSSNNPYLKPSTAWNYDLGASIFSKYAGLFTTNVFYKEIDDLIFNMTYYPRQLGKVEGAPESIYENLLGDEYFDPAYIKSAYYTSLPVNNPNKTYYRGIELSWQTNLWYLPGLFSGIVLDINYSRIFSETKYPYFQTIQIMDTTGFIPMPVDYYFYRTREGNMLDQPKSIYNIRIGYDYKGFSSRLSFRYQGATLSSVDTQYRLKDSYNDKLFRIDFSVKQDITKHIQFYANFANINKHIDDSHLNVKGYYLPTNSEHYGFTSQFGITCNF